MSDAPEGATQSTPEIRGVHLSQVYSPGNETGTDVDIIAIHGLDTKSPETWTWVDRNHPKQPRINWLQDPNMLPSKAPRARIFTCDWPADMFETSSLAPKTLEELARLLLAGIERRPSLANGRVNRGGHPIVFIASCLGGIILMKTLLMAKHEDSPLIADTRGIVFLSTPFRGTSFQDVAKWAEPGLTACAWFQGKRVTNLLDNLKESTSALSELVCGFTGLCQDHRYQVFTFYEKGYTSLYSKVFPWLSDRFLPAQKLLVDETSAILDIVRSPRPLNRRHVMMNKFYGPHDQDYQEVVQKIEEFIGRIREGTALQRADAWIREKHYTADRLKIERLSRETLSMKQCYINLAIVEQPRKYGRSPMGRSPQGSEEDVASHSSPFSLRARLKIEIPFKGQVELPTIFNPRRGQCGHTTRPRRIWIQGRAGVGKTTLCKKIVHDFKHGNIWQDLFDRVLWVPLRNLKQRAVRGRYGLVELFTDEYFPWHEKQGDLAHAIQSVCNEPDGGRSLFILDGLDEIRHDLSPDSDMYRFIDHLLRQPNVIVTSRPSVTPLVDLYDLELETVGFYPNQVAEYIQKVEPANAWDIQTFLVLRPLLHDLVRIPIQLDAVCYAWQDVYACAPETMTDLYMAIERGLAQKDVSRLEKRVGNRSTHQHDTLCPTEVECLTRDETDIIAGLAFTGLYNDVISFDAKCRDWVSKHFAQGGATINDTLRRLSYLRPSDPSASEHDRTYHFLHLTLQEYFAARYFVEKWTAGEVLKCLSLRNGKVDLRDPASFLQEHKYSARFDIVWRFIAGLLGAAVSDERKQLARFFDTIQQEPLDLLGPAHQRLIMHCLNEVHQSHHPFPARRELEEHLSKWWVLQCKMAREWHQVLDTPGTLASEIEFPEQAIANALQEEDDEVRISALSSMHRRHKFRLPIAETAISWLRGDISRRLADEVLYMSKHLDQRLPVDALNAITVRLEDQDAHIRRAAIDTLHCQSKLQEGNLPDGILKQIAVRLEDQDREVRRAAIDTLQHRSNLPERILNQAAVTREDLMAPYMNALRSQENRLEGVLDRMEARRNDQDPYVKRATIDALRGQSTREKIVARLKDHSVRIRRATSLRGQSSLLEIEGTLNQIAALLKDQDAHIRRAAIDTLGSYPTLPEGILNHIAARLKDQDPGVRRAVSGALRDQWKLPEGILNQIAPRLRDQDLEVRRAAINALRYPANLPEEMLPERILPERILNDIAALLKDPGPQVRRAAINALQHRTNLPKEILNHIVAQLKNQDPEIRRATIDALGGQASLPEGIMNDIAARLKDHYPYIRRVAINALRRQAGLPEDILCQIAVRLQDQSTEVRIAASNTLRDQSNLPEAILNDIAARLKDQDRDIREVASDALQGQSNLPERILNQIALRLQDRQSIDRHTIRLLSTLIQRQEFHSVCLVSGHAQGLFLPLLLQSFGTHIAWYIKDGKSCLETENHVGRVELLHKRAGLELAIQCARKEAGIPAGALGHGFE